MSLQVWLPLNGDLKNQGLGNISFSATTATWDASGKIGRALSTLNSNIIGNCSALNGISTFSLAFWCFPKTNSSISTNWCNIIALGSKSADNSTSAEFRFESSYVNNYILSHHNNTGEPIGGGTSTLVSERDKWYHIVVVANNETHTIRYYVNGIQLTASSFLKTHNGGHLDGTIKLANENVDPDCLINDVRIYDHALSSKEIEEIAKGLVLHYKLDDISNDSLSSSLRNLIWNGNANQGGLKWTTWGTATNRGIEDINGKRWFHHVSDDTGSKYGGFNQDGTGEAIKPNTYYTISATMYASASTQMRFWFHMRSTDGGANITQMAKTFNITTTPMTYSYTFNSGSNATYNINRFNCMIGSINNTSANDVYVTDIIMVEGQLISQYTPNPNDSAYNALGRGSSIIYDSSGYNRNGSLLSAPYISSDTAHYFTSMVFDGTDDGILISNQNLAPVLNNICSISFWIKSNGENGARSIYLSSYTGNPFWCIEKSAGNKFRYDWNASPDLYSSGNNIIDGVWNHICFVRENPTSAKFYLNGILDTTWTNTCNSLTNLVDIWRIGRDTRSGDGTPYKGNMSDFRIYATALTEEQVLELYHTSGTIDHEGNFYAREFDENDNLNLTKTGIFGASNIYDNDELTKASILKTDKQVQGNTLYEY